MYAAFRNLSNAFTVCRQATSDAFVPRKYNINSVRTLLTTAYMVNAMSYFTVYTSFAPAHTNFIFCFLHWIVCTIFVWYNFPHIYWYAIVWLFGAQVLNRNSLRFKITCYAIRLLKYIQTDCCFIENTFFFQSFICFQMDFNIQYRLAIIDFIGNDSKSHRLVRFLPGTQNQETPKCHWSNYLSIALIIFVRYTQLQCYWTF